MNRARRHVTHAQLSRLRRQIEISRETERPRRVRTRAARYAAALAEQLGLIARPPRCEWCHRRLKLERHHWNYDEPLCVSFLCSDCHEIADPMVRRATGA